MFPLTRIMTAIGALAIAAATASAQTTAAQQPPTADSRDVNLRAYVELLRSDVRSQKIAIITQVMQFNEAEDAKFWPIYRDYDVELSALNDERVQLIKQYADNYDAMTDQVADKIAVGAIDLEKRRNALKQKYYDRLKAELSPKTAAKFLQVENQLLMIIDLQISAALPVVR